MAAAPLDAEGAEVAANFARFVAALDDTLKVVSKPKEWKADEHTAAHWARWSFQIKNYFALLHVQMLEWLTIVEATDSEEQLDIALSAVLAVSFLNPDGRIQASFVPL